MALETFTIQGASGGQKTQPAKTDTVLMQETAGGQYVYATLDDVAFPLRYQSVADGSALASSTTETILASVTVPANYWRVGMLARVTALGEFGATATPTLTLRVRVGGVAGQLVATYAFTATAQTSKQWQLCGGFVVRTIGASGSFCPDWMHCYLFGTGAGANLTSTPVTINTTTSQVVCLTAQWGTNNALNTISNRAFGLELLPASAT